MKNEIPLIPESHSLNIILNRVYYKLRIVWREQVYVLDILNTDGTPLICGISLVLHDDLLGQLKHHNVGGMKLISESGLLDPTYDNLGLSTHLIYSEV